ncbi:hypothetical protein AAFF_G00031670 [Aldrovandia affinis]|uniref:Receptor-interacting serine/threonine-protein kinase 1 n=1 Tax=Aldrovandia affinis TaxID=143900 RepID=A0AAD7S429_9TELE|nr:hypothetical protein AAFF_G00031670 [Aldrovandia affinis]
MSCRTRSRWSNIALACRSTVQKGIMAVSQASILMASADLTERVHLDSSSFGSVCLCRHKSRGRVVLKTVYTGAPRRERSRGRLLEEAAVLQKLGHSRIVKLLGVVLENRAYTLVMEYVPKGNLLAMLDNIADACLSVCPAWSKLTREESRQGRACSGGTLLYMAPEHLLNINTPFTEKSDVYSFAIVVWVILTSTEPYGEAQKEQICFCVCNGNRPDEHLIPASTPMKIVTLMKECWMQDPTQRPTFAESYRSFQRFYRNELEQNTDKDLQNLMGLYEGPDLEKRMSSLALSKPQSQTDSPVIQSRSVKVPAKASIEDRQFWPECSLEQPLQTDAFMAGPDRDPRGSFITSPDLSVPMAPSAQRPTGGRQAWFTPGSTSQRPYAEDPGSSNHPVLRQTRSTPGFSNQRPYTGDPGSSNQRPYTEDPGSSNQRPYTGDPGPTNQRPYTGDPGSSNHPVLRQTRSTPGPANQRPYTGDPGSYNQWSYTEDPGPTNQRPYTEDPGSSNQRPYTEDPGSSNQRPYTGDPGSSNHPVLRQTRSTPGFSNQRPYTGENPLPPRAHARLCVSSSVGSPRAEWCPKCTPVPSAQHPVGPPKHPQNWSRPGFMFQESEANASATGPSSSSRLLRQNSAASVFIQHASGIQIGDNNHIHFNSSQDFPGASQPSASNTSLYKQLLQKYEGRTVSREQLDLVSENIGKNWTCCARNLGLTDAEVEAIKYDYLYDGLKEIVHQMLRKWQMKKGAAECTVGALCQALKDSVNLGLLCKLLQMCQGAETP